MPQSQYVLESALEIYANICPYETDYLIFKSHFPRQLFPELATGASIPPETMMHFLPVSDFPPIFEKNLDSY